MNNKKQAIQHCKFVKRESGFSLIELVIVVVILGLLAATALPRFLNITEDAEDASLEGVAGGFASAVGLVKAQWEIEGRPEGNQDITLDNTTMDVGSNGFPTGLSNSDGTSMSNQDCIDVFTTIMQSPPPATTSTTDINNRYFIGSSGGLCYYYLIATLDVKTTGSITISPGANVGNYFTYNPVTGQVVVNNN